MMLLENLRQMTRQKQDVEHDLQHISEQHSALVFRFNQYKVQSQDSLQAVNEQL